MPIYEIEAPDGNKYRIEGPEGATREDIISEVSRQHGIGTGAAAAEPVDDRTAGEKIRDRATAIGQGATLNWGDEITAGLATIPAWIGDDSGRSIGEVYDDILGAENARYDQYLQERPAEALSLEVAGGFASPVNRLKVLTQLDKVNRGMRGGKILSGTGRGVIEGAIAGAGASDEDRMGGAMTGAKYGALIPSALNTVKAGGGLAARMANVQEKLNGRPLHLAMEKGKSALGDFYRQYVGTALGGRGPLLKQERAFIEAADTAADQADTLFKQTKKAVKRDTEDQLDRLADEKAARAQQRAADQEVLVQQVDDKARAALNRAKDAGKAQVERDARDFQNTALKTAIPDSMPATKRAEILNADPQRGNAMLKGWWVKDGFRMVKDRQFDWPDDLRNDLQRLVGEDPVLANMFGDIMAGIGRMTGKMQDAALKAVRTGKQVGLPRSAGSPGGPAEIVAINGDALMELRNFFARGANRKTSPHDDWTYRQIANKFDAFIREQLKDSPDDLAAFNDQLRRWRSKVSYEKAVGAAEETAGRFTPKQWLKATGKKGADTGKKPLQGKATQLLDQEKQIKIALPKAKEALSGQSATAKKAIARRGRKETVRAGKGYRAQRRAIRRAAESDPGLVKAQRGLDKAKAAQKEMQSRRVPRDVKPLSQIGATAIVSGVPSIIGSFAGPMGAVVAGSLSGRALASRPVQKFLAGQTSGQEAIKKLAANPQTRAIAEELRKVLARQGAQAEKE